MLKALATEDLDFVPTGNLTSGNGPRSSLVTNVRVAASIPQIIKAQPTGVTVLGSFYIIFIA